MQTEFLRQTALPSAEASFRATTRLGRVSWNHLHADISQNRDHVERFFNEAKIVGKIKHAGIVEILDCGAAAHQNEDTDLRVRASRGQLLAREQSHQARAQERRQTVVRIEPSETRPEVSRGGLSYTPASPQEVRACVNCC